MIFRRSDCETLHTLLFTRDVAYTIIHQLLALGAICDFCVLQP